MLKKNFKKFKYLHTSGTEISVETEISEISSFVPFVRKYLKFLKFYFSSLYNIYTAILSARAIMGTIYRSSEKYKIQKKTNVFWQFIFFQEKYKLGSALRALNIAA
mgnify:CR=1 FL=1